MGYRREDRLRVRHIGVLAGCTGFAVGALLPSDALTGEPGRVLVTFLGLVAASILPTVSLILTSMTAGGRSVLRLRELSDELQKGVSALFWLFGLVCISVGQLLLLSVPLPIQLRELVPWPGLPNLIGQSILFMLVGLVIYRAFLVPRIIQRCLTIRAEIAIEEAKRKTLENAPAAGETAKTFRTKTDFGKRTSISELIPPKH